MVSFFHTELIPELDNLFEFSDFEHCSREPPYEHIFALDPDPGDEMRLVGKLDAGGKPSTWFPPGRLVELIFH